MQDRLLERVNTRTSESKLTFNIIYYPAFQSVRNILRELQILLAQDKEHKKVFPKINNIGGSALCGKGTCQVCVYIIRTNTFTIKGCEEVFKIQSRPINYN